MEKLVGFYVDKVTSYYKVVIASTAVDELSGIEVSVKKSYFLVGNVRLKSLIGKEVVVTYVNSPKLNRDVVTGIKLAKAETAKEIADEII